MAHSNSAKKRVRASERRRHRNLKARSRIKTLIRKARQHIDSDQFEQAQIAVGNAISALDKAAEKGVLHKNNASRRKARLMQHYNAAFRSASAAD